MSQRILLVRHGRSAHVHSGAVDAEGFRRWRAAYEAAGLRPDDEPLAALKSLAAASGVIVTGPAPRAIESAKRLDPTRDAVPSPLLDELELAPPELRRLRLPLAVWALAFGIRMLFRPHVTPAERQRARDAAEWLAALAGQHGTVLAVTHASFRPQLVAQLVALGWSCEIPRRRFEHWSAWSLTR